MGEHTSNTAVQLMMHPVAQKPMLLCGQTLGSLGDRNQNHEEMMDGNCWGSFFYGFI